MPSAFTKEDTTPLPRLKAILGVPGYPVSGIIVIEELLKPLIACWLQHGTERVQTATAKLTRPVVSSLKYQEFVK